MKKKGLIISTIVMVVVLIASLTTATYAWFSSQVEAQIKNLNVTATALEGVEIAVKTTNPAYSLHYTNGTLAYNETDNWTSDEDNNGFGALLDFGAVELGTITNAVTKAADTSLDVYTLMEDVVAGTTDVSGKYSIDNATAEISSSAMSEGAKAESGKSYATKGSSVAGNYYRPVGYDSSYEPTGYYPVGPNIPHISYYDLPLAVKTTKAAKAVVGSISLTNKATGSLKPGMAAATRVEITINSNTYVWQPYEHTVYTPGSGISGFVESEGTLNFVLMFGSVEASDICDFRVVIWVEGTDNECNNTTLGDTNFDVDFGFDFISDTVTEGTPISHNTKSYQWLGYGSGNEVYLEVSHS